MSASPPGCARWSDLPLGIGRCLGLLRSFRPHVVVGVGGYASGPAMMAAILLRVPTLAFEPNAVPGMANRLVGQAGHRRRGELRRDPPLLSQRRRSRRTPYAPSSSPSPPARRGKRSICSSSAPARALASSTNSCRGSWTACSTPSPRSDVVHQTGGRHGETTLATYRNLAVSLERVTVTPYLDDMAAQFAAADLILCRSGASTIAELAAAGRAGGPRPVSPGSRRPPAQERRRSSSPLAQPR